MSDIYRFIVDESPNSVFILDDDTLCYANDSFNNLIGYNTIGESYTNIFNNDITNILTININRINIEDTLKHNNTKVKIDIIRIEDKFVCFCYDESNKINYNDFLHANDLKSSFLSNMSHNIKTPLNAIMGFSELLLKSKKDEDRNKYFMTIKKSSNTLLNLFNKILDISIIESGDIILRNNKCILLNMLYDISEKYSPVDGVDIIIDKTITNTIIYSDCYRINQILDILMSNAIKFTKKGHIKLGYTIESKNIIFWVEDTGIGIDKSNFDFIFEKFTQIDNSNSKKYSDIGLDLSISKSIVKLMGGNIWLTSEINKGSTFYFSIPSDFFQKI